MIKKVTIQDVYDVASNQKLLIQWVEKLISDSKEGSQITAEDLKDLQFVWENRLVRCFTLDREDYYESTSRKALGNAIFFAQLIMGGDTQAKNYEGLKNALNKFSLELQSMLSSSLSELTDFVDKVTLNLPHHYLGGN